MRYIIHRNAWGDGMKAETSFVPELFAPFEQLKAKCREIGVEFITFDQFEDGMDVLCALLIDCPPENDPLVKMWVHRNIPNMFLLICENLYLQPNGTYLGIGEFADEIFSYEANPKFPDKTTRLRYPVDLKDAIQKRKKALSGERPYLCGMIQGFKGSPQPGDLYAKRAHIAATFSNVLGDRFLLYGNQWNLICPSLGTLPPGPDSKYEAYRKCEFAVVMENNNSIPGYVTEKIFNALAAGCIPIYEGYPAGDIPGDCYIDGSKFDHPLGLLTHLEGLSAAEKLTLREAGGRFLAGDASRFDSETHVNTLFEAIKEIA